MPKNRLVFNEVPKNNFVFDEVPKNKMVFDEKPNTSKMVGETTRSYSVAHTVGVIMLTVPLITYSSAGTETQWGESGGIL